MEAVAAVGVASATVQFLDFSVKTLAACKEIRDSSTGSTKVNEELTRSVKQLKAMQKTFQQSAHTLSTTYRQLIRAIQDCSRVADELLQLLEYVREVAQKSLGTMRAALRQVREGKRIEKLQAQLSSCQDRFQLALTAEMRDSLLKKMEEYGQNSDSMRSIILQKLASTNGQIRALDKNVAQIAGVAQKQICTLNNSQQKASASLKRGQRNLSRNIDSHFSELSTSSTQQDFLDSLYFPEMFARQESMKKSLPGTYDWVFDGKLSLYKDEDVKDNEELRGRISRWLHGAGGASTFWISGKPGSGKSSLMSCIMSDKRTLKCLQTWADGRAPHVFSFFFWKPGSKLQKTIFGLMRSLIWQLCKARPSIIDQLLSRDATLLYSPWTETRLADILKCALSAYHDDPLFFVIDGLDECEDYHSDLLDELQSLNISPHTKVCISSRPEQAFCQQLRALPSVRLQDLNYRDILKYANMKLKRGDDRTKGLARDVAAKAEGVFLWAVLVCDSLFSGLMAEDDEETLLQRLKAYPRGLDDLFDRMFANLEEVHYKSLAFYFFAARQHRFTIALAVASQPTQKIESLEQFNEMCEHEVIRVTQQSKGLLQVRPFMNFSFRGHYNRAWSLKDLRTGSPILSPAALRLAKKFLYLEIEFVHRSAYDYVFKDTRTDRASWLRPVHRNEIIHKVLNGALWLCQYGPILHLVDKQLRSSNGLKTMLQWALSADDRRMAEQEWFCHELEKLLDSLQTWTSAVKVDDEMSRELTLLQFNGIRPSDLQHPLREFWYDSLYICPEFVASHSSRLCDRDDTHLNVAALLDSWSDARFRSNRYKRSVDSAMSSVATGFRRQGLPHMVATFPQMQGGRFSILKKSHLPEVEAELVSWQALSTYHEGSYVFKLRKAAGRISTDDTRVDSDQTRTDSYPPDPPSDRDKSMDIDILGTFCALVQRWQICYGTPRYVQEIPLPLQLSVPMLNKYPPTSRYLKNAEMENLLSCRAERRLRLSCFARRGPETLEHAEKEYTTVSPIASYCLSSVTTNALLMRSDTEDNKSDGTRFVGSVAELSDCSQMVMGDIWEDAENQLTAWEQLYLRACVKLYFLHFWRRRDP